MIQPVPSKGVGFHCELKCFVKLCTSVALVLFFSPEEADRISTILLGI